MRLSQTARKFNVGTTTIISYLKAQGIVIGSSPNTKITADQLLLLEKTFAAKKKSSLLYQIAQNKSKKKLNSSPLTTKASIGRVEAMPTAQITAEKQLKRTKAKLPGLSSLGKIDLNRAIDKVDKSLLKVAPKRTVISPKMAPLEKPLERTGHSLKPLQVLGTINVKEQSLLKRASSHASDKEVRRPRKRIFRNEPATAGKKTKNYRTKKEENAAKDFMFAGLSLSKRNKYRKERKEQLLKNREEAREKAAEAAKIINVAPLSTPQELAKLFDTTVGELLSICIDLGIIASINQRLTSEVITILAEELNKEIAFIETQKIHKEVEIEIEDLEKDLIDCAPVITVMGHVDHGKTSFLDYIRKTQITATEEGGITQHIRAYDVYTKEKKKIVFLDTPGHATFTAMRSRGAELGNMAIIIIASDDGVMPQTWEAIHQAQAAGIPMVFALNKMDKPDAAPKKIKEQLAQKNILVEEWGGKYQCQEISAKTGEGIDELLEKVAIEGELLALKANPNKKARGSIVEATLAKGRGYLATVMVQSGTLYKGDIVVAGGFYGKVKALLDSYGKLLKEAGPATPVQLLGLNGPPPSGERMRVVNSERAARTMVQEHQRLTRAQQLNIHRATTQQKTQQQLLGELAAQEKKICYVIIKAEVDGIAEALSDSLIKLSNKQIEFNVVHKAVGPISESDVLLATASQAAIIGFNITVMPAARKLAKKEKITIKHYSIIYKAIEDMQQYMNQLIAPTEEVVVIGRALIKKVFHIGKVGIVAGCEVIEGIIKQNAQIRQERQGKILTKGKIKQLKREKDQIKEAKKGSECGIFSPIFEDLLPGDTIEAIEIKKVTMVDKA